jgi:hypothetical protein
MDHECLSGVDYPKSSESPNRIAIAEGLIMSTKKELANSEVWLDMKKYHAQDHKKTAMLKMY